MFCGDSGQWGCWAVGIPGGVDAGQWGLRRGQGILGRVDAGQWPDFGQWGFWAEGIKITGRGDFTFSQWEFRSVGISGSGDIL